MKWEIIQFLNTQLEDFFVDCDIWNNQGSLISGITKTESNSFIVPRFVENNERKKIKTKQKTHTHTSSHRKQFDITIVNHPLRAQPTRLSHGVNCLQITNF